MVTKTDWLLAPTQVLSRLRVIIKLLPGEMQGYAGEPFGSWMSAQFRSPAAFHLLPVNQREPNGLPHAWSPDGAAWR